MTPYRGVAASSIRKRSSVLPWSTNAAVVPEKYRSASCDAHGGNHAGRSAGRLCRDSGAIAKHSAQIGIEDRRRFLELIAEPGEGLQLADGLFGLLHALGRRIDLAA